MGRRDLDTPTTIFIKAQDGLCYTESSPEEADAYIDPYGEIRNAAEASHPAGFRPMRLVNIGERVPVGIDDAIARMAKGATIRVAIESRPGVVFTAHWRRKEVIAFIKKNGVEEAGPKSTRHGFGLASTDGAKWYFIATRDRSAAEGIRID
jgi:hypothetical protein